MKILLKTILYFSFFVIITQVIPKMINSENNYDIIQIIFLLCISIAIATRDKLFKK